MKLGIVGLPNVGKSTLFNAITNAGIPADNYAFCTIDPNVGVVAVPDVRLEWLRDLHQPKKFTPATIEFVDIAGLVKGASKGEGLGNKFLSNIRTTDAIIHVVRCFDDPNVTHVEGSTDPLRDIDIINPRAHPRRRRNGASAAWTRPRRPPRAATSASCARRRSSLPCSST